METIYDENIDDEMARILLGADYRENESYKLIIMQDNIIVNCRNTETGEERELALEKEQVKAEVPKSNLVKDWKEAEVKVPFGLYLLTGLAIFIFYLVLSGKLAPIIEILFK